MTPSAYSATSAALDLLVVDRHEHQVDVGLRPDRVVRQAAAEDGREDRAVLLHLLDQRVERRGELLLDRQDLAGDTIDLIHDVTGRRPV